jgi:hypothetical protein
MQQTLNNPQERQKRYTWRSRLRWREPERIHVVFDRAWRNYKTWFFLSGTVQDKLLKEAEERRKNKSSIYKGILGANSIWERLKREMEYSPDAPKPNRDLWKQKAMEDVAYLHQTDYDKGAPFNDPLGKSVLVRSFVFIGITSESNPARPGLVRSVRCCIAAATRHRFSLSQ